MNNDGLEKKINQASEGDPEFRQKLQEEMKRIADTEEAASDREIFIKAIKNVLGMDITMADLAKAQAEVEELDPEELDKVTGGSDDGKDDWCVYSYYCFTAWKHKKQDPHNIDTEVACWQEYCCIFDEEMWDTSV